MTADHPIGLRNLNQILEWLEACIEDIDEGKAWDVQDRLRRWSAAGDARERLPDEHLEPESVAKANALIADAYNRVRRSELSLAKRALYDAGAALRPMSDASEEG